MAKRFTRLLAALALLVFMAPSMVMWGQTRSEVTYTFSEHYSANTTLTDVAIAFDNSITGTFGKGNGSTAPQYYTNGTAVRWYGGNTLAITASNATVSEIVLTYTQKNKTVTTDVGTYNHDNGTWSGSASSVTFTVESGSGHNRVSAIKVTYSASGSTPTCATPTFSPAAGTYTQAQSVSISCATEGATVYYTTNGQDPTTSSTVYSEAINVSTNMTIKAMATAEGYDNSAIATAEYAFITLEHAGTLEDPYTVADARTAIDANAGTQGVYATGIVSEIPTAWSSQYNNITFNFVDEQGDENFLQAYRCVSGTGVDASTVAVGDIVVVYGNLTKHGSTYEFGQGCELVSLTSSGNPSITADNVNIAADATNGSIAYTINNPATTGAMAAVTASDWLTLGTDFDSPIAFTCTANTATTARTATVVLTYTYNRATVTKEVTVTQAGFEAPNVTWDLSIDETATATTTEMTWTSDYATMGVEKANATTNTNNYYPGTEGQSYTSTRFYKNSELTIAPVVGYAITSVVFTATTEGYASALGNSAWTNATASAVGTTVTVTPTDGTTAMVAVIGGTCGFTSVTVYYVVNNAPTITANNVEITYDTDGDEIEFVINNPVSGGSLVASTESDWLEVGDDTYTSENGIIEFSCSVNQDGIPRTATITLTYTYNRATVTKEVTVTQAGNPNAMMTIAEVRAQETGDVITTGTVTSFSVNSSNKTTAYIQDATAAIVVFGEYTVAVGDEIRVSGALSTYHGLLEIINPEVTVISQGNTVTPELMTIADAVASTNQGWYIRIEEATVTEINDQNTTIAQGENTIVVRGISGVEYAVNDVLSFNGNIGCYDGNQIVNPQNVEVQAAPVVPSITITPDSFELDANSHMGEVLTTITYQNIVVVSGSGNESFDVQYYDGEGQEIEQTWCTVGADAQGDTEFNLIIAAGINEGNEARTAYFKLVGHDEDNNLVYSNLVTVTQAALVIDYAVLPFVWEGGPKADFLALNGVTAHGLGSDYASSNAPYLIKFDNTGDYIQVKCDQQPGKVTIGVKMIGGGVTSTITIQSSADGETFTYVEELTISGAQNDVLTLETTNAFAANVRYVRMLFTKGSNVGVGPISIAVVSNEASIAVNPDEVNVDADEHDGTLDLTYESLTITDMTDFDIQFCDANGDELSEEPDWIEVLVAEQDPEIGEGYVVSYYMVENEGPDARTAYFKVYAMDDDTNLVYSNLVTINQAAAVVPPTPGTWVLTDLADLTEDDVFVIVGTRTDETYGGDYAMSNDNGTSNPPAAVAVTVVEGTLSAEPAANLQWNISITEEGYIFYPNGETETWLYCTNTNNGVRVGTNDNNVFTMSENGYLHNTATERYIGIYNSQDWRCYTSEGGNIAGQSFAFYKKVESSTTETQTIALSNGTNWFSTYLDITLEDLQAALVAASSPNKTITIKSPSVNSVYSRGRWNTPASFVWDVTSMYYIIVSENCEIVLEGTPIDPAAHTITIAGGGVATWIGYPFSEEMSVTAAFAALPPTTNDKVKNSGTTASYTRGRWNGEFNLAPGFGYIYISAPNASDREFTYPSGSSKSAQRSINSLLRLNKDAKVSD